MESTATATRTTWTVRDKYRALSAYAETNSLSNASKASGVPETTIWQWANSDDGQDFLGQIRTAIRTEFAFEMLELIALGLAGMRDRIVNGEERITAKGDIVRMDVSLRDLSNAVSMLSEQHQKITGQLTDKNTAKAINALAHELLAAVRQSKPTPGPSAPNGNAFLE